jgi:hypothetical protein
MLFILLCPHTHRRADGAAQGRDGKAARSEGMYVCTRMPHGF